jgi:arabinose-5-phosphate isomerase
VALLEVKGFKREDFARLHPGGALGRKLLMRVSDVMVDHALPAIAPSASMRDAIVELSAKRGIAVVVNGDRRVQGVVTTGDLTRLMERERDVMGVPVSKVMSRTPRTASADELASAVVFRMQEQGVVAMPVLDGDDRLVGIVHLHDLMRAGAA